MSHASTRTSKFELKGAHSDHGKIASLAQECGTFRPNVHIPRIHSMYLYYIKILI